MWVGKWRVKFWLAYLVHPWPWTFKHPWCPWLGCSGWLCEVRSMWIWRSTLRGGDQLWRLDWRSCWGRHVTLGTSTRSSITASTTWCLPVNRWPVAPEWQQLGSFEISIPYPQSSSKRQADAQLNRSITRPAHSQTKPNMTTLTPSSSAGGIAQRTFELANHIQVTPPRPLSSQLTPWYQRSSRRIGWSNWFDRL